MYTAIQSALLEKMQKFGWKESHRDRFYHDDVPGVAVILRTEDNVAILYPDGSMDRGYEDIKRKQRVLPRPGWYSKDVKNRVRRQCLRSEPPEDVKIDRLVKKIESLLYNYDRKVAASTSAV